MSKAWGGVGAWALDAELAEAEEKERAAAEAAAGVGRAASPSSHSFPSLKEAAAAKTSKKKKGTTMTLAEFNTGTGRREVSLEPKHLTTEEMLRLPTGPRERSAEEMESGGRLGGGFRSYGSAGGSRGGGGFPDRRSDDRSDGSWGGGRRPSYGGGDGGGFDDDQRRSSRSSDFDQPSRADEVDNWAAGKKTHAPPPMDSGRHQDRYGSLATGGSSRADDVDNWSMGKKPIPSRYPSLGSGYRGDSAPSDSGRWVRGGGLSVSNNGDRERPRLVLAPPKGDADAPVAEPARNRPNPFGAARPREEVLTEKGLDWKKMDSEIELKKTSRPTSSHSSRPSSAQSSRPGSPGLQAASVGGGALGVEVTSKPRQKVNPFGDAKPREVLLEEKGKDWRKIDLELEHRSVDRPETEEEKLLKEEIDHLKKALAMETQGLHGESAQISAEELSTLREQIVQREKDLSLLISELDDKVRFGQKATSGMRPGSGAGRSSMSSERPPSRSEDSRNVDFTERPRSRGGMGDAWAKTSDDRSGFHRGQDGGFFGSRDIDRSKSRERW